MVSAVAVLAWAPMATAQSAPGFVAPKTSWGAPDLTGLWTNESRTIMGRPKDATKLTITAAEETKLLQTNVYTKVEADEAGASDVSAEASKKLLADENANRGYNRFWMEPGSHFARVKGEIRTSWVVDPPDGKIPYKPSAARGYNDYAGPEARPNTERCLRGFTNAAGPVIGNGMYNNNYEFVQTPGYVMLFAEMIFDARIIPITASKAEAKHGPSLLRKQDGDAVGWYEGNTLVVETVGVPAKTNAYVSDQGKVIERFTRWDKDQILYEFTVDDPSMYTQTWKGEMSFAASNKAPFEYACHEGNYGLLGILAGARKYEKDGRTVEKFKPVFGELSE
jgi:hypothetical protein